MASCPLNNYLRWSIMWFYPLVFKQAHCNFGTSFIPHVSKVLTTFSLIYSLCFPQFKLAQVGVTTIVEFDLVSFIKSLATINLTVPQLMTLTSHSPFFSKV